MELDHVVEVLGRRRRLWALNGPRPRVPKSIEVARTLRNGYEREFDRRGVVSTRPRSPARVGRRRTVTEAHERQRELVDAIRAHQASDSRIPEPGPELWRQSSGLGNNEGLGERSPGIPVEMPEAPLRVTPAGAPRNARQHDRRRLADRRWADLH
jgi:hypothetical protein